jgi:hypothetical protein
MNELRINQQKGTQMKKAIFGILFIAIVASLAFAEPYTLCHGYAYVGGIIANGWTISCSLGSTGTHTTDSTGYFYITAANLTVGDPYYLKATKAGQQTKYTDWYYVPANPPANLGNVSFSRSIAPPLEQ